MTRGVRVLWLENVAVSSFVSPTTSVQGRTKVGGSLGVFYPVLRGETFH